MQKTGSNTAFPDHVRSIEFYHMYVRVGVAGLEKFKGAVLFGAETGDGCEIARIIPPVPPGSELRRELDCALSARRFAKLNFLRKTKRDVLSMLGDFCLHGVPLPNVFESGSVHFSGLTPFQLKVYLEACAIPQGETRSYSWLSSRITRRGTHDAAGAARHAAPIKQSRAAHAPQSRTASPAAQRSSRAVGGAMRSNPFPILIPCHRIVLKNGAIGGFMGKSEAGLERGKGCWQLSLKKALLELEGLYRQPDLFSSDVSAPMAAQGANVFVLTPKLRDAV